MIYKLRIDPTPAAVRRGHLALGGRSPEGKEISVNSSHIEIDGQPFIPISGEFHFSRYPHSGWKEALQKMAAGGINVVATYLFWIHHEVKEGTFDWSGDRNLRLFLQCCAETHLPVVLRVGPFAHGECRNGGLPDWLYGQPFEARSNDPAYLAFVIRYYQQISDQVNGFQFQQGGPIIGIQIENEYMHSAAPWETNPPERSVQYGPTGNCGAEHLKTLKRMLTECGLTAPLYTCTAWGGAPVPDNDFLPVFGGYAYPVWVDHPGPSDMYLFRDLRVMAAQVVGEERQDWYPIAEAEMQGGIQVRYGNRPIVDAESTEAFALMCLANGANWLGYYIYHGGLHPLSQGTFTNERLHPRRSYDFQAPLSDFGLPRKSYHYLRRLHLFITEWQQTLAPMKLFLPDTNVQEPSDTSSLRYAARANINGGFLFINNYQDHFDMAAHEDVQIVLQLPGERSEHLVIPAHHDWMVKPGAYALMPFNLDLNGLLLKYATTQPITRLIVDGVSHYLFFAPDGVVAQYCFKAGTLINRNDLESQAPSLEVLKPPQGVVHTQRLVSSTGREVLLTTLTAQESEGIYKGWAWGHERVILVDGDANLIFDQGGATIFLRGSRTARLTVIPPVGDEAIDLPASARIIQDSGHTIIELQPLVHPVEMKVEQKPKNKLLITFPRGALDGIHQCFITPHYVGDMAEAYINGQLVHDHFYNGLAWTIGLKEFAPALYEHGLVLLFYPVHKREMTKIEGAMASQVEYTGEAYLDIQGIHPTIEHRIHLPHSGGTVI
jgi:beta-galactosidase